MGWEVEEEEVAVQGLGEPFSASSAFLNTLKALLGLCLFYLQVEKALLSLEQPTAQSGSKWCGWGAQTPG